MPRLKQIGVDVDVNAVIEKNRATFAESENDILRRILRIPDRTVPRRAVEAVITSTDEPVRRRGLWTVRIGVDRLPAANLKDAYRQLLLELHHRQPGFIDAFGAEKARSRRFVSRSPASLYLASPQLAKKYAQPLADGWFFDTNLSAQQVGQRARLAARLSGLNYGRDVQILNGFEEI